MGEDFGRSEEERAAAEAFNNQDDRTPPPDNLEELHEEALTINDEVDKRSEIPEFHNSPKSELAQIALDERIQKVGILSEIHPEAVVDIIQRTYAREALGTGLVIYRDPSIDAEPSTGVDQLLSFLESRDFDDALVSLNELLPESYRRIVKRDIPPILIHSKKNMVMLGSEHTGGFVAVHVIDPELSNLVINLSPTENNDLSRLLFHELTHITEPAKNYLFNEAIAEMVSYRIFKKDIHQKFLSMYKWALQNPSDHPLTSQPFLNFNLQALLNEGAYPVKNYDPTSNKDADAMITQYFFAASFIDWYLENHKNDNALTGNLREQPNRTRLRKLIQVSYGKYKSSDFDNEPVLYSNPPQELNFFSQQISMLTLPDNDPVLVDMLSELERLSEDDLHLEDVQKRYYDLLELCNQRLLRIQGEYNQFIKSKNDTSH